MNSGWPSTYFYESTPPKSRFTSTLINTEKLPTPYIYGFWRNPIDSCLPFTLKMSTSGDYILREWRPVESLIPTLDGSLELSEKQIKFLHHAIRDVNPDAVDAEAEIRRHVLEIQSRCVVTTICCRGRSSLIAPQSIVCYDNSHYCLLV